MPASNIAIRPARPDDAEQAIPLIYSSGPEAFDWIFAAGNDTALPYLEWTFPSGAGFFGYQNHHVATIDGRIVGTIALYSAGGYNKMSNQTLIQVLRYYRFWRWPRVLLRCLSAKKWMPPPNSTTDYVANLGVASDVRSHGIGKALLSFGLEQAKSRKKATYALDVADSNPRAEALYERFGFSLTHAQASPAPDVMPGSRRLEMSVENSV